VPSAGVKFYLNGGGLFTIQGRWWDEKVEALFRELDVGIYNPWKESKEGQLRAALPREELRRRIFESDRNGVDVSQGVVMLGEGAAGEVSSGTAWETGYACARSKVVLCLRTDLRGDLNPILKQCLFNGMVSRDLEELRSQVVRAVNEIHRLKMNRTYYRRQVGRKEIKKLFLSVPYFTSAETDYAKALNRKLSKLGYDVMFTPGTGLHGRLPRGRSNVWADRLVMKTHCLDECDAVVALLDGFDSCTDTAWDCGYGYSKYKPVFGIRTDLRSLGDLGGEINLMIEQSLVDTKVCHSMDELSRLLDTANKI